MFPSEGILGLLKSTATPIQQTGGDHNVIFPVKNWYALNHQLPTLKLMTFPRDGHGPHHQHPEASAERIATFVRMPSRTQKALLEEGSSVVMNDIAGPRFVPRYHPRIVERERLSA